jgi:hypothetical protein
LTTWARLYQAPGQEEEKQMGDRSMVTDDERTRSRMLAKSMGRDEE